MKHTRQKHRPFCNRELMEAFKAMKARELQRQGKPIPLTLLPTKPAEIDAGKLNRQPPIEESTEAH